MLLTLLAHLSTAGTGWPHAGDAFIAALAAITAGQTLTTLTRAPGQSRPSASAFQTREDRARTGIVTSSRGGVDPAGGSIRPSGLTRSG